MQVQLVQNPSKVSHPPPHHGLHLEVGVHSEVVVLPDVEEGAAGQQHPPGDISGEFHRLLCLADGTREGPKGPAPVLGSEIPQLLCAEVMVEHLPGL